MGKPVILICDDNVAVHESLESYLTAAGYDILNAYDAESAMRFIDQGRVDLMILDIMLPNINGIELCTKIRQTSMLPIIMLSARSDEYDRIIGLQAGADDYVTKPYSCHEVVTRVGTVLRRTMKVAPATLHAAELTVDPDACEASIGSEKLVLTKKELDILVYLIRNINRVMSREQILNTVWGYEYYGDTRAVDTHVKRLRQKLPTEGVHFAIRSIYGIGYKLEILE